MRSRPRAANSSTCQEGRNESYQRAPERNHDFARQETLGQLDDCGLATWTCDAYDALSGQLRQRWSTEELCNHAGWVRCHHSCARRRERPIWRAGPIAAFTARGGPAAVAEGRALATWHPKTPTGRWHAGAAARCAPGGRRDAAAAAREERDKTAGRRRRSTHTSRDTHRFYPPHRSSSRPSRARRSRSTSSRPTRSTT